MQCNTGNCAYCACHTRTIIQAKQAIVPHRDALCSTSTAATISAIDVLLLVVIISGGGGGGGTTTGIGGGANGGLGTISGGCVPFPLLPLLFPLRDTSHGGIGLALPLLNSAGGCSPGCASSHA